MVQQRRWEGLLLLYMLITTSIGPIAAFRILSKAPGTSLTTPSQVDLHSLVRLDPATNDGVYKHALDILSSIQSSPSCNRIATSTLLDSCHAIDGSRNDAEHQVEDVKSIYAAQLAICEITDAGSSIPQPCQLIPPQHTSEKSIPSSRKRIGGCLQALEARPQWWTSYSNSRQNAVTLCKAARVDIDRDELIKLQQKMVETQSQANGALSQSAKLAHEGLQSLRDDFERAKNAFQEQLMQDLETSSTKTRKYFEQFSNAIGNALEGTLGKVRSASSSAESQVASMANTVNRADAAAVHLEDNVGKIFGKVVEGSSELAQVQKSQWETSRGTANDLLASLRSMQDGHLGALVQTIKEIGVRLDSSNQLIAQMFDRQNNIEERMGRLTQSFTNLETKADALSAAQSRQGETQSRLHGQMEVDMQVAQGYLSEVASSAMQLQATVADTSTKIQSMAAFANIFGTMFDWTVAIVAIIVLVVAVLVWRAVWRFSRLAGCCCFMIVTVLFPLRDFSGMIARSNVIPPSLLESAWVDFKDPFSRASFTLGFAFLIGAVYLASRKRHSLINCSLLGALQLPSFWIFRLQRSTCDKSSEK